MSNTDRLNFIKAYFAVEDKVKVEVPPTVSETIKGKVIKYFEGQRLGYSFKRGIALVERKDVHLFHKHPHFIIHDVKRGDE
ncbi:hypothetical protein FIU87_05395 [Bacillus sp. THAF10]|uniref:hypothetical protein n=1 Tax=Bacillus sp. THAF10 TaxID=2587848 RepID=UPI001269660E|nr:hypothetical protein [Bacillus sp. THAF10]QFT88068.1 hypothetical protein FIU87_05395 [Bacillus sp. THAF10]